jgi:hypothetical protein
LVLVAAASGGGWSSWRPQGKGPAAKKQIAAHVQAEYKLPSGKAFLAVRPAGWRVAGTPIREIAVYKSDRSSSGQLLDPLATSYFVLCGLGPGCTIPGTPSTARSALAAREALELALYTFEYQPPVRTLVVLIDSGGDVTGGALLFTRAELSVRLRRPLTSTLPSKGPFSSASLPSDEAAELRLVGPWEYSYTLDLTDGGWVRLSLVGRRWTR